MSHPKPDPEAEKGKEAANVLGEIALANFADLLEVCQRTAQSLFSVSSVHGSNFEPCQELLASAIKVLNQLSKEARAEVEAMRQRQRQVTGERSAEPERLPPHPQRRPLRRADAVLQRVIRYTGCPRPDSPQLNSEGERACRTFCQKQHFVYTESAKILYRMLWDIPVAELGLFKSDAMDVSQLRRLLESRRIQWISELICYGRKKLKDEGAHPSMVERLRISLFAIGVNLAEDYDSQVVAGTAGNMLRMTKKHFIGLLNRGKLPYERTGSRQIWTVRLRDVFEYRDKLES